jgi:diaminopimelate decarboxylase
MTGVDVRAAPPQPAAAPDDSPRRGRPRLRNEILRRGTLGGVDPAELATRFGTPCYVYDLDVVDRQVAALRAILPSQFELAYAVKANPSLAVVGHLGRLGLGADVASGGELALALRAGIQPERIVFTGPGKREPELRAAVEADIRAVTVESRGELERLEAIAHAAGRRVPVLVRAGVGEAARLERVRLVGDDGAGKFGMDPRDLVAAARHAADSPWLDLFGLHAFGASNVLDAPALADHIDMTVAAAEVLARDAGVPLRLVDVGGGLGIPYEAHDDGLDLVSLGARFAALAARLSQDPATRDTRILLEPGRFLLGSAGAYVTSVVDRKVVAGTHVVIVDGGIHHLLRPALVGQEHRVRVLTGAASTGAAVAQRFPVTVAGPLCSGLDVFAQSAVMALPDPGDLVAVLDVGAYGATESMPFFLSHPIPPEIVIRDGIAIQVRPRIQPETWLAWQSDPAPATG